MSYDFQGGEALKFFIVQKNFINEFSSLRSVAKYIGVIYDNYTCHGTISSYIKSGKLFKNKFYFRKMNYKPSNN